jgi:hypothetical protein
MRMPVWDLRVVHVLVLKRRSLQKIQESWRRTKDKVRHDNVAKEEVPNRTSSHDVIPQKAASSKSRKSETSFVPNSERSLLLCHRYQREPGELILPCEPPANVRRTPHALRSAAGLAANPHDFRHSTRPYQTPVRSFIQMTYHCVR